MDRRASGRAAFNGTEPCAADLRYPSEHVWRRPGNSQGHDEAGHTQLPCRITLNNASNPSPLRLCDASPLVGWARKCRPRTAGGRPQVLEFGLVRGPRAVASPPTLGRRSGRPVLARRSSGTRTHRTARPPPPCRCGWCRSRPGRAVELQGLDQSPQMLGHNRRAAGFRGAGGGAMEVQAFSFLVALGDPCGRILIGPLLLLRLPG